MKVKLIVRSPYAEEVRCKQCSSLLFKARFPLIKSSESLGIEIKCRKCGTINRF